MNFAKAAQQHHAEWANLSVYQQGKWQGHGPYPHILRRDLFLNGQSGVEHVFSEVAAHLKNDLGNRIHMYAHHLTSSQILTYNFFKYFLCDDKKEKLLLRTLDTATGTTDFASNRVWFSKFEMDGFEKTRHPTNFDFYLETVSGKRLFFEVKYTENEFGAATHNTFGIYQPEFPLTLNFKMNPPASDTFCKNYQIYRNIWHCRSNSDYVFFLYPEKNYDLAGQLNAALAPGFINVFPITWETLVQAVGPSNPDYFDKFRRRYLF